MGGGRLPAAVDVSETAQSVHRNDSLQKESGVQEVAVLVQGAVSGVGPEAHFFDEKREQVPVLFGLLCLAEFVKNSPSIQLAVNVNKLPQYETIIPLQSG